MRRRLLLLAGLAAASWGAVLLLERPWQGDAIQRTAAAVRPLFPDFARRREEVRRMDVLGPEGATTLEWRDDRWWVREKEHPADPRRLVQIVDMLEKLETRDPVAVTAASHGTYGVAAGQGVRITLSDARGQTVADWIVGQLRQQDVTLGQVPVLEFYMRRADRPEVYLSGDAIQPSSDPVAWCDTRFLAALTPADVEAVRRENFDGLDSWRIERTAAAPDEESGWRLTEPPPARAADAFAGDSLVHTLLGLTALDVIGRAADAAQDAARYGFPSDRFHVTALGQTMRFELGKPNEAGDRFLRVEGLPFIYLLRAFDVAQLRQTAAGMQPEDADSE
jgi:hypothetical protein